MKNILLTCLISLIIISVKGQYANKLDSLRTKLAAEKSDTGKVILNYRIAYELQFSDPEKSLTFAQKALDDAQKLNYKRGVGNSLIQLGNIEQVKGNYSRSTEYNLKALDILAKEDDKQGIAICYNNLGILAHNSNDYSKALDYYMKSLNMNRETGRRSGEATSLICIGTVFENQMKYDSALFYYLKAREISEAIADTRLMAICKTSMANIYFMMGNYDMSLEYNEEAIALFEKTGNNLGLLKVYSSLGQTAERISNYSLAINFYKQALKISTKLSSPGDEANIYFSIAQLCENTGKTDSATINYEKANTLYRSTGNRENYALSLIALARLKNYGNNFRAAKIQLEEALTIAREIESPSALTEAYRELAFTYSGMKDFKGAFTLLNRYSSIRDSVMTVEKQRQILEIQTQFETERKEKENEILRKDQKILQTTRNSLIIGTILLMIIAVLILRSLSIKKKDNRLLQKQKEEINRQKEIVEIQKTSITDSIRYAKRIQAAMLPPDELQKEILPDSFILYLPRDIVSGDFYWIRQLSEQKIMICVADCTGHGVPGAFMSMLGMSHINDIVNLNEDRLLAGEFTPADILNELRERIKKSLRQTGKEGEARDGMDISFCMIDKSTGKVTYSGANNPIYIVNNETLTELKATRNPIGIYLSEKSFTDQVLEVPQGSVLYLFSDGYSDQIGSDGGKFLSKNFRLLLTSISHRPMDEIKETLYKTHLDWRKDEEQVDDILVAGIKI